MIKVIRSIECFEKDGDEWLVDKTRLPDSVVLEDLQKLFNVSKENPMYDGWDIEEKHVDFFRKHIEIDFDFERYNYQLGCTSA